MNSQVKKDETESSASSKIELGEAESNQILKSQIEFLKKWCSCVVRELISEKKTPPPTSQT